MKKWLRRTVIAMLVSGALLAAGGYAYLQHPKFGALPAGARLQAIERSPHYVNGEFQNLINTPMRTQDTSFTANVISMLFDRNPNLRPSVDLPSTHVDLKALPTDEDVVVWMCHSSYCVQLNGKRVLIDPVFSTNAGPFPRTNVAFPGTSPYSAEDMPPIDALLITHDHWDHLDYPSITALLHKVAQVVVGLGVGEFFERWGYPADRIHEADWNDVLEIVPGMRIHVLPARHYSGRMLTRNKTLWVAFALEVPERRLFFSGDSGYGPHFREIGERFGGFDLVALDMGQYDKRWANIHMIPEQAELFPEGVQVIVGDLTRADTLHEAVAGVNGIIFTHGIRGNDPRGAEQVNYGAVRNVLNVLKAPVQIVLMSTVGVTKPTVGHDWKRRGERLVRASGLPYTIVRPGWFDYNTPDQHRLVLRQGDTHWAGSPSDGVVARSQIAEVLVASLTSPATIGKTFELVAERGAAQTGLEPLFSALPADSKGALDGIQDRDNLPLAKEPSTVVRDLDAMRGRFEDYSL